MQYLELWGKTPSNEKSVSADFMKYHPLLFHMLDTAAVAQTLWDEWLSPNLIKRFEQALFNEARKQVIFFSGVHDFGKATPGFQKKSQILSAVQDLRFSNNDQTVPHGRITSRLLIDLFDSNILYKVLARVAGGHHGAYPRAIELRNIGGVGVIGNKGWRDVRQELLQTYSRIIGFDLNKKDDILFSDAALPHLLAGLITVADWISSDQEYFPCVAEPGQALARPEDYWDEAQKKANKALTDLGWLPKVIFTVEKEFQGVFDSFKPNELQIAVSKLIGAEHEPYLLIVEAPMGQGKTEAALYAADLALCRGFARGIYVAMPTQATSNAMYERMRVDYLCNRGHHGNLNLQLVHGDAMLASLENNHGQIATNCMEIINDNGINVEAQSWFAGKKKPLLAPFGVGTIDQSLLSVLQTKHWFLRAFGLSGKVIVFDEVHAYDAYMSTILERLLCWLSEMDCTVILLSATLPSSRKNALIKAYSGSDKVGDCPYPRITKCMTRRYPKTQPDKQAVCIGIPTLGSRTIQLLFTGQEEVVSLLQNKLSGGGCAAVICNTVGSAQAMYMTIKESLEDTEIMLFHARTLQSWRREQEKETLSKFGKGKKGGSSFYENTCRPVRAVLVATQVVEQSLDLDFDLMISEIAPVDLLLQRLGRLHRHQRQRPEQLSTPELLIICDAEAKDTPPETFGKNIEYIYDRYILLRTWYLLKEHQGIVIPDDIERLIELVYGDDRLDASDKWEEAFQNAKQKMEYEKSESEKKAKKLLVEEPAEPLDMLESYNNELGDDDDPLIHRDIKAATRLGDPSVAVVFLAEGVSIKVERGLEDSQRLLDRSIKISHRGLYRQLIEYGETPKEWVKSAHLRYARLLRLNQNNEAVIGDYSLEVNYEMGLVINKREG